MCSEEQWATFSFTSLIVISMSFMRHASKLRQVQYICKTAASHFLPATSIISRHSQAIRSILISPTYIEITLFLHALWVYFIASIERFTTSKFAFFFANFLILEMSHYTTHNRLILKITVQNYLVMNIRWVNHCFWFLKFIYSNSIAKWHFWVWKCIGECLCCKETTVP